MTSAADYGRKDFSAVSKLLESFGGDEGREAKGEGTGGREA